MVQIMTDTVAQLTEKVALEHGIKIVPAATIYCDGKTFIDGVDITSTEAYELLAQNPKQFNTAAMPQHYITEILKQVGAREKEIFYITLSSKISVVHDVVVMASQEAMGKVTGLTIRVFDSLSASGGEGLIALAAAKAAAKGLDFHEIAEVAFKARQEAECLFVFETLADTYRSGRIPRIGARAADVLGVKPLCRIHQDGKVHAAGLARSRAKGIQRMLDMTRERVGEKPINVIIGHTASQEAAEDLKTQVENEFNCRDIFVSEFSPVMGYATGPGILGISSCPDFDIPV